MSRYSSRLEILDKDVTLTTNSSILNCFFDSGFANLSFRNKTPLNLPYNLKDPEDIHEILTSIVKFAFKIFRGSHHRYWALHGIAFSWDSQATILLGDHGSGKSSLCFVAGLCGGKIISEEPVLVDKTSLMVLPFRYLMKIDWFRQNFLNWDFASGYDFNHNRFIKKDLSDFNLFTKEDLNKLNIEVEDKETPLKNIVFLENKRCDSLAHLYKHCLIKTENLEDTLLSLNNLVRGKNVRFIPRIHKKSIYNKEIKKILKELISG